jgi:hypothetical protein
MVIDELGNVYNVRRCNAESGVWLERWFAKPDHDDEMTTLVKELTKDTQWSSLDECPDPDVSIFIPDNIADTIGHMICASWSEGRKEPHEH